MEKHKKKILIINITLLLAFVVLMVYLTARFGPEITRLISKPDEFRDLLVSYGPVSVLVFILFQVLQVVIAAIPGEFVQIAGGYVYGTVLGTVYSTIGILLGSMIAFYISRVLGYNLVRLLVAEKSIEKFDFLINSQKSEIAMFVLFLLPGLPKDVLVYVAGLTPIKTLRFFIIIMLARLPAMLGSSYIGANIHERNYLTVTIVSVISCILFIVGVLKKDAIINRVNSVIYGKKSSSSK